MSDMENTVGSWDMYGQDDPKRYAGLQETFFANATEGVSRRSALQAFVAVGGAAACVVFGAKGAKDANGGQGLPIVRGPQQPAQPGPRGRL